MIQRIQSVYLLIAAFIIILAYFLPFATFNADADLPQYILRVKGFIQAGEESKIMFRVWPVAILLTISVLLSLVTIFLYKKRLLQIRLSIANIIFLLGSFGLALFYINDVKKMLKIEPHYDFSLILPIIAIILLYLAIRGIAKDEKLVRSLDRLR